VTTLSTSLHALATTGETELLKIIKEVGIISAHKYKTLISGHEQGLRCLNYCKVQLNF